MELAWNVAGGSWTEAICGSCGNGEKRKMFSHREQRFPIVGADSKDKDWLRREVRICARFDLVLVPSEMERALRLV